MARKLSAAPRDLFQNDVFAWLSTGKRPIGRRRDQIKSRQTKGSGPDQRFASPHGLPHKQLPQIRLQDLAVGVARQGLMPEQDFHRHFEGGQALGDEGAQLFSVASRPVSG